MVYSFFPKAVATKFTNVCDLNLKQISIISIVVLSFLKKSLEVATALEKLNIPHASSCHESSKNIYFFQVRNLKGQNHPGHTVSSFPSYVSAHIFSQNCQ